MIDLLDAGHYFWIWASLTVIAASLGIWTTASATDLSSYR